MGGSGVGVIGVVLARTVEGCPRMQVLVYAPDLRVSRFVFCSPTLYLLEPIPTGVQSDDTLAREFLVEVLLVIRLGLEPRLQFNDLKWLLLPTDYLYAGQPLLQRLVLHQKTISELEALGQLDIGLMDLGVLHRSLLTAVWRVEFGEVWAIVSVPRGQCPSLLEEGFLKNGNHPGYFMLNLYLKLVDTTPKKQHRVPTDTGFGPSRPCLNSTVDNVIRY